MLLVDLVVKQSFWEGSKTLLSMGTTWQQIGVFGKYGFFPGSYSILQLAISVRSMFDATVCALAFVLPVWQS